MSGIDLDAVKRRLDKLQNQENRSSKKWKPTKDTKTQVRIVPYKHKVDVPFIELYFHYNLNGRTYVSPISYGGKDPLVEAAEKLRATGDKEDWKLSKKLEPKLRTYSPIVVRGEEETGVRFWGYGKTVYTELLTYIADPDWGDITHPETGRDFVIDYQSAKSAGTNYPKTTITMKPNQTPLVEDDSLMENLLENQPKIEEVFRPASYDDLNKALHNWLNPDSSDPEELMPLASSDSSSDSEDEDDGEELTGVTSTDDVSEAFDDLFDD